MGSPPETRTAPGEPLAGPGTGPAVPSDAETSGAETSTTAAPGLVTGSPRTWLRAEGLAIAAAALLAHASTGAPWWLVPALFLVPDLSMLGYLAGNRVGAWTYNLAHTAPLPVALLAAGLGWDSTALTVAGVVGRVHVGVDRFAGYGVTYDSGFGHTHLGFEGPAAGRPRAHTHH